MQNTSVWRWDSKDVGRMTHKTWYRSSSSPETRGWSLIYVTVFLINYIYIASGSTSKHIIKQIISPKSSGTPYPCTAGYAPLLIWLYRRCLYPTWPEIIILYYSIRPGVTSLPSLRTARYTHCSNTCITVCCHDSQCGCLTRIHPKIVSPFHRVHHFFLYTTVWLLYHRFITLPLYRP